MKKVCLYLLSLLVLLVIGFMYFKEGDLPYWLVEVSLGVKCGMVGSMGGILYCLRSVYLNRCVHNRWDERWEIWYYLRPVASLICGFVAFLFLKAGLVILDAAQNIDSGEYGYFVFAFLAGLNVDRFVEKIEDIGKSLFGIEKSRVSKSSSNNVERDSL